MDCLIYRGVSFRISTDGNKVIFFLCPGSFIARVPESWCARVGVLLLLTPAIAPFLTDRGAVAASPRGELQPPATCHLPRLVASEDQAVTLGSLSSFALSAGT